MTDDIQRTISSLKLESPRDCFILFEILGDRVLFVYRERTGFEPEIIKVWKTQ